MQCCTFRVAGVLYGIDVLQVQEIIHPQAITPVPLAPSAIQGLINLRGQIVTATCLRRRLGLDPRGSGEAMIGIILRHGEETVSLLADAIGDVIEIDDAKREDPPETVPGQVRSLLAGVVTLERELLLLLAADAVLDLAPR